MNRARTNERFSRTRTGGSSSGRSGSGYGGYGSGSAFLRSRSGYGRNPV